MSELSPAAQAVLDALCVDELNGSQQLVARAHAAAALSAAVEQVLYEDKPGWTGYGYYTQFQNQILAIAAELEGQ